jgi:hypothetical protein
MNTLNGKLHNFAFPPNDTALAILRSRLESDRWWVIIPTGLSGHDLIQAFESQFYADDNSVGFEVMVLRASVVSEGWDGAVMVAFALKQCCPPSELARWLAKLGCLATAETLAERDFHFW